MLEKDRDMTRYTFPIKPYPSPSCKHSHDAQALLQHSLGRSFTITHLEVLLELVT